MSTLLLIRHGQGTLSGGEYDQLSPVGIEQARALGRWLAARGLKVDRLLSGPRKRHSETAELVRSGWTEQHLPCPQMEIIPEWDEHCGQELMMRVIPKRMVEQPELKEILRAARAGSEGGRRHFFKLWQEVSLQWVRSQACDEDLEKFSTFRSRVEEQIRHIARQSGKGNVVLVVTSGGPVAAATGRALDLDDEKTLQISWQVRNASCSEFIYSGDRFSLLSLNQTGHLPPGLVSFI